MDITFISTYDRKAHVNKSEMVTGSCDEAVGASRFQQELEKRHLDMRKKMVDTRVGDAMERNEPDSKRESDPMDLGAMDQVHQQNSNSELFQENYQLKKDLRRARRLYEVEKAQKVTLQQRLGELGQEIVNPKDSKLPTSASQGLMIQQLKSKMLEYDRILKQERERAEKLKAELAASKKENNRCNERLRLMLFHHLPGAAAKFQDIGPVNPTIIESANRVADYQLGNKLGEGHYGCVAEAKSLVSGQKFAIKVLRKDRITRFKDLQQVAMEVHVLKKYPHPNIVHSSEVIHASDNLYIVTELCLMDLHKYHNDIGLSEQAAQEAIFGVLSPLLHLHSHGICHLDLKPENILLATGTNLKRVSHNDVRLCDFGLVSMARRPEESKDIVHKGYVCGTPGFYAPEMILKNEFEGCQADMWSLGCILLELTLGFTREWIDSYDLVEQDSTGFRNGLEACLEDIAPAHYPKHQHLLNLIHRCLSIDSSRRITAGNAICHPWLAGVLAKEEGRQDCVFASRGSLHIMSSTSSQLYAERSGLLASAISC
eukprot:Nitzschia sp. Nitz4//scaffold132_size63325//5177//6805//NITZ4_006287-RA/size63325-processed-gene-0.13-mRNA-1//1//CDS//3329535305//847//frame0